MVEGQAAGLRDPGRDGRAVGRRSSSGISVLEAHHPGTALQAGRGVDGGQGDPLRRGRVVAVRDLHDRHVDRRGQLVPLARSPRSAAAWLIFNMGLGEVAPGGVGSGLYGILVLAIVTVFVAGLMVGRTPEYLRKKITAREIKLVSLYILTMPVLVLAGTGLAMALSGPKESILNPGPHGLSEVLYAFMSAGNNNGSAFAGLSANTDFYNTALGLAMLAGRFLPIVLVLALAGSLARQQPVPATAGTLPTHRPLFVGMLVGVDHHRRRADLLPGARARPAGGGPVMSTTPQPARPPPPHPKDVTSWPLPRSAAHASAGRAARPEDAADLAAGRAPQARPARHGPQPGHVRRRGRRRAVDRAGHHRPEPVRLVGRRSGCGSPWCSPTSPRRSPRAAARPRPRPCAGPRPRPWPGGCAPTAPRRPSRPRSCALGDRVVVEAGRDHPRRRRRRRGRRQRRRVRHHRRVRAGHPRVRRRPQLGHRRHQGAVGPHRRADHRQARRELHRPDDRPGRGRLPAEDAERDRAEHPAGQPDDRLPDGDGHPAAVRDLLRRRAVPDRAGRPAGLPDPDHHRGAAVGDRHRRHGPARAAQRAGHVRSGRRGGRRREHPAAGQDRHHHARQPAGGRVHPGRRRRRGELADAAQLSSLADETPEGRSIVVLAKTAHGLRERQPGRAQRAPLRRLHRADPDERGRPRRRTADPQGRGRRGHEVGPRQRRASHRGGRRHRRRHLHRRRHPAGGRRVRATGSPHARSG